MQGCSDTDSDDATNHGARMREEVEDAHFFLKSAQALSASERELRVITTGAVRKSVTIKIKAEMAAPQGGSWRSVADGDNVPP